ncbi:MAG: hypothetical protein IPJ32_17380 [Sphingobacteriaceae bacterium]|nr:hypothetical protein [Sphingobacteriaceae bacterium]
MINNNKKQANDIRNEANSNSNNAAKLGGVSNAEEKEAEIQLRQYDVINMLKQYDQTYAIKTPVITPTTNTVAKTTPTVAANNTGGNNNVANNSTNPNNNTSGNNNVATNTTNPNNTGGNTTNPTTNTNTGGNNNVAGNNTTNPRTNPNTNTGGNTTNPRNNTNNTANNNTAANNNTPNVNAVPFKAAGVEVKTNNAYSANTPIPVDAKIPAGLIFRVQIGAFKAPVPNNAFGGLTPVNGETTPNGYIRYTAGNFDKFEDANAVKNDLRNLGYQDAFVVGFYEGRRISINEAITLLQKEGKEVNLSPTVSAGITANNNIPKNTVVAPTVNAGNAPVNNEPAVVTRELEQINGLLFTVQIGVYSRQVTRGQLYNLSPIFTEKLPSGLYRYTAGIYNVKDHLSTDRARVNGIGIKDAFSSAYYNGKRITFTQAEQIKNDSVNLKMEVENPIVFPAVADVAPANNTTGGVTPVVAPFSNGVTTGPAPTAENGVKVGEEGLSFRVQIGAYKNQVPAEIAANFQKIKEWPVDNKLINALYIYTVGNFTDVKFAKQLKDQMIGLGIGDAFVSVYQNGKKLTYAESAQYLNR